MVLNKGNSKSTHSRQLPEKVWILRFNSRLRRRSQLVTFVHVFTLYSWTTCFKPHQWNGCVGERTDMSASWDKKSLNIKIKTIGRNKTHATNATITKRRLSHFNICYVLSIISILLIWNQQKAFLFFLSEAHPAGPRRWWPDNTSTYERSD